jgi:short-subunit dehydrogenase
MIHDIDESGSIDLAIFNAGVGGVTPADELTETTQRAEEIARVNFLSPVVGATLVGNLMAARKRGRIVLIGSVTESIPLPMAPTYAATKAGLAMFADSLEQSLSRYGVGVTIASLGYIDTPMSRSVLSIKPFMMTADDAAAIIKVRLARGARRFVIPWQFAAIQILHRVLPRALVRIIAQSV